MKNSLRRHRQLDQALFRLGTSVRILRTLSWPVGTYHDFLKGYHKGRRELPKVKYAPLKLENEQEVLRDVLRSCDRSSPVGMFLARAAESYLLAVDLLKNRGKPKFVELSQELYGSPRKTISETRSDTLKAARHFLEFTERYVTVCELNPQEVCLLPRHVAETMRAAVRGVFPKKRIAVIVDNDLVSRAAAGANRVRIRGFTCFSPLEVDQLIEHEIMVHTLTLQNGREQRHLKTLGVGAPHTTLTQEGLALFAEFITNTMDLNRLRRISARVVAIDLALRGADFFDVFEFFQESGQSLFESYHSAMRIFRGGDLRGKIVFTKDLVYLDGFLGVHRFLHDSIQKGKHLYPHYLFSGRMTLDDVELLEQLYEEGILALPRFEPRWVKNRSSLMAFLTYSRFLSEMTGI